MEGAGKLDLLLVVVVAFDFCKSFNLLDLFGAIKFADGIGLFIWVLFQKCNFLYIVLMQQI
jgi:hypothetical protein